MIEFFKFSILFYGPLLVAVGIALCFKNPRPWAIAASVLWALLCIPSVFLFVMGNAFNKFDIPLPIILLFWIGSGFVFIWVPVQLVQKARQRDKPATN